MQVKPTKLFMADLSYLAQSPLRTSHLTWINVQFNKQNSCVSTLPQAVAVQTKSLWKQTG